MIGRSGICCGSLLWLLAITSVRAAEFDERSMSEPTRLGVQVAGPGTEVRALGGPHWIGHGDSIAEVGAVEVTDSGGRVLPGIRLSLQHLGDTDQVYLDASQARQFRDELANLPADVGGCDASNMCVYGIARCRPSQDVKQALCPSTYQTRGGEHGIALATPRTALRFPDADAQEFVDAFQNAISALADRDANR